MNAMVTLSAQPNPGWRRYAIALLAVPAILVGLLAMHFLASESHSPGAHSVSMSAADSVAPAVAHDDMPTPAVAHDPMPAPTDEMLGMACVLALLVSAVLLVLHVFRVQYRAARASLWAHLTRPFALPAPAPPSLHVLCISRT